MTEIYLDNCATTRPYNQVVEYISELSTNTYGNPSSLHYKGIEAEKLLKKARQDIARVLMAKEDEVYFTSGGTEANNLAVRGSAYRYRRQGNHLITTAVEHSSVLNSFRRLQEEGFEVDCLPVNSRGYISLAELGRLISPDTILVSINHVNNEIGTVEPLEQIGSLIKQRNPDTLFHVDGVQSFCKLPLNLNAWQADLFSCSAHKIHGPKGVGALWIKSGTLLTPLLEGGGQERNLRPGTENVTGIAGFGLAANLSEQRREQAAALMHYLKLKLYRGLLEQNLKVELNGPPLEDSAPHILNLSFPGVKGEVLLHALEEHGILVSVGSACHSRHPEPSHVLQALGLNDQRLTSALRFSFSSFNNHQEIDLAIKHIAGAVRQLIQV